MNKKFNKKYRICSPRLKNWNYADKGIYFITICTKDRSNFFGSIDDKKLSLSNIGHLANNLWLGLSTRFPYIILHKSVIMPNHLHGLIEIFKHPSHPKNHLAHRSTLRFQNQRKNSISSIIGSYKSSVTTLAREIDPSFAWQASFHEHIVRNERSLCYIQNYILSNVSNWSKDELYSMG